MNRYRIGFLIERKGLQDIDMSNPQYGNPGMGGTQYCMLLLAYYLSLMESSKYDVEILSYIPLNTPENLENVVIGNMSELSEKDYDIIILKTPDTHGAYNTISTLSSIKFITWSHNYLFGDIAKLITKTKNIVANVFVGKQMYDFYIDDDLIAKSTYIYNIVPDPLGLCKRNLPDTPTVTFIGNIIKAKGIVHMLKIWKKVSKKHPEAVLNIIGGGNLYNRSNQLGELGISDKDTEKAMKPYIIDSNGKIDSRIRFLGILGKEKYDVFLKSHVGVVNPSARTETFGLGIIEMACAGLPVVTRNWNGHPDTAINGKTALLSFTIDGMAKKMCYLLENREKNIELGEEAKRQVERFSPNKIIPQWDKLLESVIEDKFDFKYQPASSPIWNNYKFLRVFNSMLRNKIGLRFLPSIIEIETSLYKLIR